MGVDPDKKVEKGKEKREGLYQSSKASQHFENEGSEFVTTKPNGEDNNNQIDQDANYDKVHGLKSDKSDKKEDKKEQ